MPLIIKGVHNAGDAKRAEDLGASAVIWSNHGGRQQDGVPSALQIVADEMPKMKDSKMDFLMDGGIRRGRDVLLALSYGLKAVGLGRVCVAGIGAGGHAGLDRAFQILHGEFTRSMKLTGVSSIEEIQQRGDEIRRKSRETYDWHFVF
jgi:L-lactate dehydrogenase (cytochrome)